MSETARDDNPAPFDLALDTLAGDVRDWLLDRFRAARKPWTEMTEAEQRHVIESASGEGRQVVRRAVDLVAAHEFPTVPVTVGKFTGKDGDLKAEFTCPDTNENLLAIARAGRAVLVMATPERFFGERREAKAEPDQPEMKLDAEADAFRREVIDSEERVDPETGEVLGADGTAPGGIPLDEAQRRYEAARDANREDVTQRGRSAFWAGQSGMVPPDLAGTPAGEWFLEGWGAASADSAAAKAGKKRGRRSEHADRPVASELQDA